MADKEPPTVTFTLSENDYWLLIEFAERGIDDQEYYIDEYGGTEYDEEELAEIRKKMAAATEVIAKAYKAASD